MVFGNVDDRLSENRKNAIIWLIVYVAVSKPRSSGPRGREFKSPHSDHRKGQESFNSCPFYVFLAAIGLWSEMPGSQNR